MMEASPFAAARGGPGLWARGRKLPPGQEKVSAGAIIDLCRPKEEVRWVLAYGREGYSTNGRKSVAGSRSGQDHGLYFGTGRLGLIKTAVRAPRPFAILPRIPRHHLATRPVVGSRVPLKGFAP